MSFFSATATAFADLVKVVQSQNWILTSYCFAVMTLIFIFSSLLGVVSKILKLHRTVIVPIYTRTITTAVIVGLMTGSS